MIPRTNLFKGDRVRLSQRYIVSAEMLATAHDSGTGVLRHLQDRCGVITNDTLSAMAQYIRVKWDGNEKCNQKDLYLPDDLVLVEEEVSDYVRSPYMLLINFKSNERAWKGTHDAYKIYTDDQAMEWARRMEEGMGDMYDITLVKTDPDGKVIDTLEFRHHEAY